jgi:radical SAM superfamily enzyme YgiQ (UPF0313 family)
MKVLLTTLNARFVHTSLALRYLEGTIQALPGVEAARVEFTINSHLEDILGDIFLQGAQVAAFSCYIWNIDLILQIAGNLKKAAPNTVIILGGPEVSYETETLMENHSYIDFVVAGEGEETFPRLIKALAQNSLAAAEGQAVALGGWVRSQLADSEDGGGIFWRESGKVLGTAPVSLITLLDSIPSPYQGELTEFKEKIAYVEASRGCPFSCSYCLSAALTGVRYFSRERVIGELIKLIDAGARQVKFVDRTFNVNKEYALEIWRFLAGEYNRRGGIAANFHFEISADLLDHEQITFLTKVPPGLFQFEIGVQSTNPETLAAINRRADQAKLVEKVLELRRGNNIHLHLDLIAGLPYEDRQTLAGSFNQVISLKPHRLQLGFLKLLKGSPIREQAERFRYVYLSEAPYQVLANEFITYAELLELKDIEEVVERVYNSRQYFFTMDYLLDYYQDKLQLFRDLLAIWQEGQGKKFNQISQKDIYPLLAGFGEQKLLGEKAMVVRELVKFDLLRQQRLTQLPDWAGKKLIPGLVEKIHALLAEEELRNRLFPGSEKESIAKLAKQVHLEPISLPAAQRIMETVGHQVDEGLENQLADVIFLFAYGSEPDPVIGGARFLPVKLWAAPKYEKQLEG